jgi:hypothetical protein
MRQDEPHVVLGAEKHHHRRRCGKDQTQKESQNAAAIMLKQAI